MQIIGLSIENIGGIGSFNIQFDRQMNIICGSNGVGKTTVLECIAHSFVQQSAEILKKRAGANTGHFEARILNSAGDVEKKVITINDFGPNKLTGWYQGFLRESLYLLSLKVNRGFGYTRVDSITRDTEKHDYSSANEASTGVDMTDVKAWLLNRILYSSVADSLSAEQTYNLSITKSFFSILDPRYTYSRVIGATNDIMINTPDGEIFYEYLSSGFRACLAMLFGIAKEIEFRFKNPDIKLDNFNGVILVDEAELHLHPEWQAKIPTILKTAFPLAQFILTTHSPHLIQAALSTEIIALEKNGSLVTKRELTATNYGFQGWTVEEILVDVMGMQDTRTSLFHDSIKQFEMAVDDENYVAAEIAFNILNELLHPENHLRKLLAFQLGALKG
jgi:energy-coupling factor transporter ATP-binding protein EcfA2